MVERLEGRRLLSGNVTVVLDPATFTLVVHGDNKSNDIVIPPFGDISYTIVGRNGTTVNGAAFADLYTGDAVPNFAIDMGNGEDVVELGENPPGRRYIVNDLVIRTGNGSDTVKVDATVDGNLDIDTGNGDDHVELIGAWVFGNLKINTGNGDDSITLDYGDFGENRVGGNSSMDGGRGQDVLTGIGTLYTDGTQTIVDVETVA
jgi:hypothetical protein